jgi:hypothetical protein
VLPRQPIEAPELQILERAPYTCEEIEFLSEKEKFEVPNILERHIQSSQFEERGKNPL